MQLPSKGQVSEITFTEVLKDALQSELTGMVRMENGPIIKVVYFNKGTISFASSNEKSDRLTEVLKRAGKLTPEQVEDAQARLRPNVSLGKTLVELGYISARDLLWGARAQVEGILHQLLFWNSGNLHILEGPLPKEIVNLNLEVPSVIFDGIQKTQDREWVLQQIDSPEAVYALSNDFEKINATWKLPVENIASALNGKRSLYQIAETLNLETFEICKSVAAMQLLGMLERAPSPPVQLALEREDENKQEIEPATSAKVPETDARVIEDEPQKVSLGEILQIPTVAELRNTEESSATLDQQIDKREIEVRVPMEDLIEEDHRTASPPGGRSNQARIWILSIGLIITAALGGWYYTHQILPVPAAADPKPPVRTTNKVITQVKDSAPQVVPATPPIDLSTPLGMLKMGKLDQAATLWKEEFQKERSRYTIQLVIACEKKTVLDAFGALKESPEAAVLPMQFQGRSCYRVVYGVYPSREAAARGTSELPAIFVTQTSPAAPIPISKILK